MPAVAEAIWQVRKRVGCRTRGSHVIKRKRRKLEDIFQVPVCCHLELERRRKFHYQGHRHRRPPAALRLGNHLQAVIEVLQTVSFKKGGLGTGYNLFGTSRRVRNAARFRSRHGCIINMNRLLFLREIGQAGSFAPLQIKHEHLLWLQGPPPIQAHCEMNPRPMCQISQMAFSAVKNNQTNTIIIIE